MTKETKIGLSLIGTLLVLFSVVLYKRLTADSARRLAEGRVDVESSDDGRVGRLHKPVALTAPQSDSSQSESAEPGRSPMTARRASRPANRAGWNRHAADAELAERRADPPGSDDADALAGADEFASAESAADRATLDAADAATDAGVAPAAARTSRSRSLPPAPRGWQFEDDEPGELVASGPDRDDRLSPADADLGPEDEGPTEDDEPATANPLQRAGATGARRSHADEEPVSDSEQAADAARGAEAADADEADADEIDEPGPSQPLTRAGDFELEPAVDDRDAPARRRLDDAATETEPAAARPGAARRMRSIVADRGEAADATETDATETDAPTTPPASDRRPRPSAGPTDADGRAEWRHDRTARDSAAPSRTKSKESVKRTEHQTAASDDVQYTIEANDSFASIAAEAYGDGALGKALAAYNRRERSNADRLRVGDSIAVPDVAALRRQFPDKVPAPRKAQAADRRPAASAPSAAAGRSSARPSAAGQRVYVVADGDTLFDIARHELGRASRWAEIYRLNQDVLDEEFDRLRPGTELILPTGGDAADDVAE